MEPRRWLKVGEVAERLGCHVVTVRKMVLRGEVPYIRRRGLGIRIDMFEYERDLARGIVRPRQTHEPKK